MRTRFAPSPTGRMHLGNVWIAFLNWLWTRQHRGAIVLRIEDIDRQRCRQEYVQGLMDDLEWLGLDWDEGPGGTYSYGTVIQSDRINRYRGLWAQWREEGQVYPCYCSRARLQQIASAPHRGEQPLLYDGRCRDLSEEERRRQTKSPSWRMKTEECRICFTDIQHGLLERTLYPGEDDFVLIRADGMIAYQLAAAADDSAMDITHVFRGNDLLSSTFLQAYLLTCMKQPVPVYSHLPLLTDHDGVRLSKRQRGITATELREQGMTADSIIGQLLYWAGALSHPEPMSAEKARSCISYADCCYLTEDCIKIPTA